MRGVDAAILDRHLHGRRLLAAIPGPAAGAPSSSTAAGERELSGGETPTTNQRMELTAPARRPRARSPGRRARRHLQRQRLRDQLLPRPVVRALAEERLDRTPRRSRWTTATSGSALIAEVERHDVTWHKVAGHSGDPLNDRADALARGAIARVAR